MMVFISDTEVREGPMNSNSYTVFETSAGFCGLAWSDAGLTRFQLPTASAEVAERLLRKRLPTDAVAGAPPQDILHLTEKVRRYFAGEPIDFSQITLDLDIRDDFFKQIYSATRRLAWGQTTTYGELARSLGAGREKARDVGEAMASNPVPLIIPCHRVLAAGGRLGGFSAPGGSASKAKMLELEGVHLEPVSVTPLQQSFGF